MARLVDRKSWLSVLALTIVNEIALRSRFRNIEVTGRENLPKDGAFILISNHSSRWDSLIVQKLIGRRANYMTSPNELVGFQGAILPGIGSFPARASRDVVTFIANQAKKKEAIVIFPEGNVFYDGTTHPFKSGVARIALAVNAMGVELPIIPIAIQYDRNDRHKATVMVGQPVCVTEQAGRFTEESNLAAKSLTASLHREVCYLKVGLGNLADSQALAVGKSAREWSPLRSSLEV